MLSASHLILVFLVALLVFGPEKLPELARTLSKAMAEFHRITGDFQETVQREMRQLEREALDQQIRAKSAEPAAEPAALPTSAHSPEAVSHEEPLADDSVRSSWPGTEDSVRSVATENEEPETASPGDAAAAQLEALDHGEADSVTAMAKGAGSDWPPASLEEPAAVDSPNSVNPAAQEKSSAATGAEKPANDHPTAA